jgi:hypothetical protein
MINEFYILFFLTILLTRIFLYYYRINEPRIRGIRLHHYMYGPAVVAVSLIIHSLPLYAIGLALFVDELTFIFLSPKDYTTYLSKRSVIGTLVFVFIVYLLRYYLVALYIQA